MKARKWMWIGLMSLACPAGAWSQVPGVPAAPAVPGAIPAAAPADPTTLWSFLGISHKQCKACIREKCQTPCGQMINKMFTPMTMFSGGIIPGLCPLTPSAEELADQGAVGAAAAIKAEEAQAKARKAAMRYLGTVDCTRFPDAQGALIKGLRGDTNECVRFEAALALGNGCCCTKATMEALSVAGSCSDRDGLPREYSDRVRAAAVTALQRCLSCYVDPNPPKQEKIIEGKVEENRPPVARPIEELNKPQNSSEDGDDKEAKKDDKKDEKKEKVARPVGMDYYARINNVPRGQIVEEARRVVEKYNSVATAQAILSRQNSVVTVINQAVGDQTNGAMTVVMDNGMSPKAEVMWGRPQNLWEMVSRQAEPMPALASTKNEPMVVVQATPTFEPPAVVLKTEPMRMPEKIDSLPKTERSVILPNKSEPIVMKPADVPFPKTHSTIAPPVAVKPLTPLDIMGPYGENTGPRPKTPAELASAPRSGGMNILTTPIKQAPAFAMEQIKSPDLPKQTERQSLKPIDPPKVIEINKSNDKAKPTDPPKSLDLSRTNDRVKPVELPKAPEPTALAQRAMTLMIDPHPPAVREQITSGLTAADVKSCPEVVPVLVEAARSGGDDTTRKAAIRALVRCNVNSPIVISSLEKLQDDSSPTVRVEAAIGVAKLRVSR